MPIKTLTLLYTIYNFYYGNFFPYASSLHSIQKLQRACLSSSMQHQFWYSFGWNSSVFCWWRCLLEESSCTDVRDLSQVPPSYLTSIKITCCVWPFHFLYPILIFIQCFWHVGLYSYSTTWAKLMIPNLGSNPYRLTIIAKMTYYIAIIIKPDVGAN